MIATDDFGGFRPTYGLELLGTEPFSLDDPKLISAMKRELGNVVHVPTAGPDSALFACHDFPVKLADAEVVAQIVLFRTEATIDPSSKESTERLAQSWRCPDAAAILNKCKHQILITDMFSSTLSHTVRMNLMTRALKAVLPVLPVDLISWTPTQQYLVPKQFLDASNEPAQDPTIGFLNVRFFTLSDHPGDMIMDTLGLTAYGLTDLQIHYRELDPSKVAACLAAIGAYLFEKGDVIKPGETVQGLTPEDKWLCRHEDSLLSPKRMVLDINPGHGFAAGDRD